MNVKLIKRLAKGLTLFLVVFGLLFSFNLPTANACVQAGFNNCNNPFSFFTGLIDDDSQYGSLAAVGTFFFPTDYAGGAECTYSEAGSMEMLRWAASDVSLGEIHLYAQKSGMFFDWAAAAIYDTYSVNNFDDAYVTINYEGTLSPGAVLAMVLGGNKGFEITGDFGPFAYEEGDTWQVKLSEIASPDETGSFKMAFGAAVFVFGEESSAVFADLAHTITISFTDENGNLVGVGETPGGFSQVPIPGTILLFIPGLVGIFAFRRKKS